MSNLDNKDTIVCHCGQISVGQIVDEIEAGAQSSYTVMEKTSAGMFCGSCIADVKDTFDKYKGD